MKRVARAAIPSDAVQAHIVSAARRWLKPMLMKRWWRCERSAAEIGCRYFRRLRTTNDVSMIGTARTRSGRNSTTVDAVFRRPGDRDRREREAEHERARVAHEDPRREEVVAEEPDAGAGDDRREHGRVDLAERQRDHGEGDARDRADAGGEPVHPVEEVDHVHHRHDPDDRERHADPRRHVDGAEERQREVVDPDAERRRDRGGQHLAGQLHDRRQPAEVVDRADDAGDCGAEQDAAHLAREIEERERRDEDAEEDREPAEPWDRAAG